ncbi:MAG: SpoIVB peptidase [Lachnospira sp.]
MTKKRSLNRFIFFTVIIVLFIAGICSCYFYTNYVKNKLPKHIYINQYDSATFDINVPVTGNVYKSSDTDSSEWESFNNDYVASNNTDNYFPVYSKDNAISKVDFNKEVTFVAGSDGHYRMEMRMFGLFYLDSIDIDVVDKVSVYPCGFQTGLYIKCDGVLVVSNQEVVDSYGNKVVPCEGAISPGDYIVQINGENVENKQDLAEKIKECGGNTITFTIKRDNEFMYAVVNPVLCEDNSYKMGLWVKDDAQGVGTVTYVDMNCNFGALGHGISDNDTSTLLSVKEGRLYKTRIISIKKGKKGEPGELIGVIDYRRDNIIGQITKNTEIGLYGKISSEIINDYDLEPMEIGYSHNCTTGKAYIRLMTDDSIKDYEIKITELKNGDSKNITFKVTDPELLELTNGIVQGMSGCPIIQDGKIIGAVTHVLIQDSTKGYGIYIEKMLDN